MAKQGLFEERHTETFVGGGQTYQIPEVLAGKSYNKTVDLYLYGVLTYEMLCGKAAFPFKYDVEEHEQRIINCKFTFPDEVVEEVEEGSDDGIQFNLPGPAVGAQVSEAAKQLIRSLIVPEARKRLPIDKIKSLKFFAGIKWSDVEQGRCKVPRVLLKEPKAENFDEISYDSDDEDFAHEFQTFEEASKPAEKKEVEVEVSNLEKNQK